MLAQVAAETFSSIRDPLARLWSHADDRGAHRADRSGKRERWRRSFRVIWRGQGIGVDYAAILPKLARAVPGKSLLVPFQEEMMTLPGTRLSAHLAPTPAVADLERRYEGRALACRRRCGRGLCRGCGHNMICSCDVLVLPEAWRRNMEKGFA